MIIGRGGAMIKRSAPKLADELEAFFGTRVYLDLRVKVDPAWRDNDRTLDALGVPKSVRRPGKRGTR